MIDDQTRQARLRLVDGLRQGHPWQEATRRAGLSVSRRTAYRLLRRVRAQGDSGLEERRHGQAYKMGASIRHWLAKYCRGRPDCVGHEVQAALHARFGLTVSISQINRVRAALGLSRRRGVGGKSGGQRAA